MGDRYEIDGVKCPYCKKKQEIYYAHSSCFLTKKCSDCGKESIISMDFGLLKATEKEIKQHYKDNGCG